jgi:uncharacterized repeat protein (TIGR01451 family)
MMRICHAGWLSGPTAKCVVGGIAVLVLLAAGLPASAATKQEIHDQMASIKQQIEALKGQPGQTGQLAQLQSQFDLLVAELGYRPSFPPAPSAGDPGPQPLGGPPPPPPNCVSSADTFPSTDTPIAISDVGTPTITSTLNVSGVDTYLWDVEVATTITHTWNADLQVTLQSPQGTIVTLTSNNGEDNDNVYNGTIWNDDANPGGQAPYVTNAGLVTDHPYVDLTTASPLVPEEALAAFRGEDPSGDWVMTIADQANLDGGNLASWTLTLRTLPAPPIFTVSGPIPSADTPIAITDVGTPTITSTVNVAGVDTYLWDVDVDTSITHTWNADLQVTLQSPQGTIVTLTSNNGEDNDNVYDGTTWDNDANPLGQAPYANNNGLVTDHLYVDLVTASPLVVEEAFAAFRGEDSNGDWVMTIADQANLDGGSLDSWSPTFHTATCVQPDTDLEVIKSGVFDSTTDQITWTVTVTNNGPDDATGVVVTDPLDPCTSYISDDCGGLNVPPWTWNVGNLANGAGATCNIVVDASGCPVGQVSNTATASGNETDPTPGNEVATTAVQVGNPLEIPTLGRAGLVLLLLAISLGALVILRRRG